jgi:transposase
MMIPLPTTIFVATMPINLRLSFDRLAGIVRDHLGGDPRGAALFIFHNRRGTHLKLLWHDSHGYRILFTRLDRCRYRIPLAIPADARQVQISERELRTLLDGIDMSLVRAARRSVRNVV